MNSTAHSADKGYVYILSNPAMPGIYKVGRSIHGGNKRANQIYKGATGVPSEFVLEFEVYTENHKAIEGYVHGALSKYRIASNREFFRCGVSELMTEILSAVMDSHCCEVNHYDEVFTLDDVELIVEDHGLNPANEYWKLIHPLITRFFKKNPDLLEQALSYIPPKREFNIDDWDEEIKL